MAARHTGQCGDFGNRSGFFGILELGAILRPRMASAMIWRQIGAALTLFPLLLCAQPQPAPDDELAEALERVYLEADYQRELPQAPEREPPAWLEWLLEFLASLEGLSAIGRLITWAGLAVLALALVYFLSSADYGRLGKRLRMRLRPDAGDDDTSSAPVAPDHWLRRADSLARKRNYAAAIHTLLLGVLGWMRTSQVQDWPPAATAREILARHGGAREPLELLVRNAELVHFGGWSGSDTDYQACRACATALMAERNFAR